jgi:DNA-binding GntR family transcriptional regulator
MRARGASDDPAAEGEPRTRDLQEHHQLVSLIVDGRAAEAAQLMRGHITHSLTATAISALEDREGTRVT